mmetsp:Transcript_89825/g.159775  ORF Transcript_89825/g.159775 Transcript_89825/m.159775 type:complete len:208 (+) Transcript_89825:1095-1718(+)
MAFHWPEVVFLHHEWHHVSVNVEHVKPLLQRDGNLLEGQQSGARIKGRQHDLGVLLARPPPSCQRSEELKMIDYLSNVLAAGIHSSFCSGKFHLLAVRLDNSLNTLCHCQILGPPELQVIAMCGKLPHLCIITVVADTNYWTLAVLNQLDQRLHATLVTSSSHTIAFIHNDHSSFKRAFTCLVTKLQRSVSSQVVAHTVDDGLAASI